MITITEALGELRLVEKKLEKKRNGVQTYLCGYTEPLSAQGGSTKYVASERESVDALMDRHIAIRIAIQESNRNESITIDNEGRTSTQTIAEWLTWKRELSNNHRRFLSSCIQRIEQFRTDHENTWHKQKQASKDLDQNDMPTPEEPKLLVHADEKELRDQLADLDYQLERLDTALTLHNSTVTIDVE